MADDYNSLVEALLARPGEEDAPARHPAIVNALAQTQDRRPAQYWPNQLSGATAYDEAMRQARGLQAGLTHADPVEMAMGLIGPRARIPSLMRRIEALPQAPTRDMLPSDLPLHQVGGEWSIRPPSGDQTWGGLFATTRRSEGAVEIGLSDLAKQDRGHGLGIAMYQRLIDQAHKQGYVVRSDNSVSPDAQKIYEALAQRGYRVQRSPRATADDMGTLFVAEPREPVFTVHPPEYISPAIAKIMEKYGIAGPAALGAANALGGGDQKQ